MRYAVVSDIHSNIVALEAVVAHAREDGGFDQLLCLGDTVGYGPWPRECIELLQSLDHVAVAGNHDWASIGNMSLDAFHAEAAEACAWNGEQMEERHRDYIASLPLTAVVDDFTLAHGSPRNPLWEYLLEPTVAAANLAEVRTPHCLVGHSHLPLLFRQRTEDDLMTATVPIADEEVSMGDERVVFNPGSVGQPRDGDPRSSYAIYDSEAGTLRVRRVDYDIARVQKEMNRVGLPERMAQRLAFGW